MAKKRAVVAGGEMAVAQYLQLWPAGVEPDVSMTLSGSKPRATNASQVVVLGRVAEGGSISLRA